LNQDTRGKSIAGGSILNTFSDDEDTREMLLGTRSKTSGFTRPSKDSTGAARGGASKRGRGGKGSLKQTTLSFSQSRLLKFLAVSFYFQQLTF
jgi:double-strand break repair protein MRE11